MHPQTPRLARLSSEQKREALQRALASRVFERAEQLRKLLGFICEAEIEGRGREVDEYRLGTEALGRPADFSPTEESIVRNRTHALRKKLEEAYAGDLADDPVRIHLPKGQYVPVFVERQPDLVPQSPERIIADPEPPQIEDGRRPRWWVAAALFAVVMVALLAFALIRESKPTIDPALAEFWGPLLERDSNVALVLAAPAQLLLRDYPGHAPPSIAMEPSPAVRDWYLKQVKPRVNGDLRLLPQQHSPLYGDSLAAVRLAQTLGLMGVGVELLPESVIRPPALRDRNVVIVGRPEYSDYARALLEGAPLRVEYCGFRAMAISIPN